MNEMEENVYKEIRNELTHYYNVGKLIIDAQGGEDCSEYGDGLIRKISSKLTNELGKGYSTTSLKYMRQLYVLKKVNQWLTNL